MSTNTATSFVLLKEDSSGHALENSAQHR